MHRFDRAQNYFVNRLPSLGAIETVPHDRHVPGGR
jgi:hypothetical protein